MPLKKNYSVYPGGLEPLIYGIPSFILIITGSKPQTASMYTSKDVDRGLEYFCKYPGGEANMLRVKDGTLFTNCQTFLENEENLKILQVIDNVTHM